MVKIVSKFTAGVRRVALIAALGCLIVASGCGSLSQGRTRAGFGSEAEEAAFAKQVAADSFPQANRAFIDNMTVR